MAVKGKGRRKGEGREQHVLSLKVTAEQKDAFVKRCSDAGVSRSEMLARCLFGRQLDEPALAPSLREHLALVHQLRDAVRSGMPAEQAMLDELVEVTRALITTVRQSLG